MVGFNSLPFKFLRRNAHNSSGIDPSIQSTQPVVLKSPAPPQKKSKSLAELEKEAEAKYYATYPYKQSQAQPVKAKPRIFSKIIWATVLLGIPVGAVWVANLPYPVIRRPVAQTAPILLVPSYMSLDENFRQAIASVEQAQQLIDNPTSPADLDMGAKKVKDAQKHLDALPIGFLNDLPEYRYWWYDSRFSIYGFNSARTKVGQLEAKVFQEKNAQTLLTDSELALNNAKQQYQQAATPTDKQIAIASWRSAIDQLKQVPSSTLAGKTTQAKLESYQRDFQEVVGLAAGNERISLLIQAARQFSWEAAKAGQNPPHNVTQWQQIESLWQEAIIRLEKVPLEDSVGYGEAQKLLVQYKANLGQVQIRHQAEADAVRTLAETQTQIGRLQANAQFLDRNNTISQLQSIINELKRVQNGTTAYLEAQNLLLSAQNKLNQLQSQPLKNPG